MDYMVIELPIKTKAKLDVPESYRIYANNELLVERNTHWDTEYYYVNEKIVIKNCANIELILTHTLNNKLQFNSASPFLFDYVKVNNQVIYPDISSNVAITSMFCLSHKIKITV